MIGPSAARKPVNTDVSHCRFWLQFSTENGPGPGSSVSLDNISFSMDCFLACEYSKMWIFFLLASLDILELLDQSPDLLNMANIMHVSQLAVKPYEMVY